MAVAEALPGVVCLHALDVSAGAAFVALICDLGHGVSPIVGLLVVVVRRAESPPRCRKSIGECPQPCRA